MKHDVRLKRSIYNFLTSLMGTIIAMLLGLIIPRLVLINYGSEINGLTNSINQFVSYLGLFEAGIGTAALQALYKPVAEDNKNEINGVISALNKNYQKVGTVYLFCLVALSVVYPIVILKNDSSMSFMSVFLCVLFSGLGNVVLFFLQGKYRILMQAEGKSYILTNIQTLICVLISISKIVLINLGFSIVFVIFATFFLNLIQVIYIMVMIFRKYKWIDLKMPPSKIALSQKNYVFVHQIAGMVFQNTDILILTIMCDLRVVSVYSMYKLVVSNIERVLSIPFDSCSFALGQIYSLDVGRFTKTLDCIDVFYGAVCFATETVVLCLYTPFLKLYTSGVTDVNYIDPYLPFLFVVIELLVFMRKPMLNTINYAGHFKLTLPQTIIETTVNLVVSLIAVSIFGIYGVLLGTIVALVYRTIDIIIYANKRILNRLPWKTFGIYAINFILCVACVNIYSYMNIQIESYTKFFLVGIGLFALYNAVYLILFGTVYNSERKMVFEIIKSKMHIK